MFTKFCFSRQSAGKNTEIVRMLLDAGVAPTTSLSLAIYDNLPEIYALQFVKLSKAQQLQCCARFIPRSFVSYAAKPKTFIKFAQTCVVQHECGECGLPPFHYTGNEVSNSEPEIVGDCRIFICNTQFCCLKSRQRKRGMLKSTLSMVFIAGLLGLLVGAVLGYFGRGVREGFVPQVTQTTCGVCNKPKHECGCPPRHDDKGCDRDRDHDKDHDRDHDRDHKCPEIDWSKYVLRASVPPPPVCPDMSDYIKRSEVPPQPDMSRYVLKSSVPPCPPCISTCSKPCKVGECPPCPRPRCPEVICPPPTVCPPCASVEPPRCPTVPSMTCKPAAPESAPWSVRPLLASISPM